MKKLFIIILFISHPLFAQNIQPLSNYSLQELLIDDIANHQVLKGCISLYSAITELTKNKYPKLAGEFYEFANTLYPVLNGDDIEARGNMMLSATLAGIGFGTAGVHIPHACAYPIAGLKHSYQASGYKKCFVPHGFSVIVTAPAVFRFTYDVDPEKHIKAAELLKGSVIDNPSPESLSYELIKLMKEVGAPSGIKELGYVEQDISNIIKGAMKQQRLLSIAPKEVSEKDLNQILIQSLENW